MAPRTYHPVYAKHGDAADTNTEYCKSFTATRSPVHALSNTVDRLRGFANVISKHEITYSNRYENISAVVKHMRQQLDVYDLESTDPFKWPEVRL